MGVTEPTDVADRESIEIKLRVLNTATLAHSHETESAFYKRFASRGELDQVHRIAIVEVTGRWCASTGSPADCWQASQCGLSLSALVFYRRAVYCC